MAPAAPSQTVPFNPTTQPDFREIASLNPSDATAGTRVVTTSTTDGARLPVSSASAQRKAGIVKYDFQRLGDKATTLQAVRLGELTPVAGSQPATLDGD